MELVYLWIENHRNINQQGFNFNGQYQYHYDFQKNKLIINYNQTYLNIFPNNIRTTVILGKNGSGKSSLLEILNSLSSTQCYIRGIIIYLENNTHKVLCLGIPKIQAINNNSPLDYEVEVIQNILTAINESDKCPIYKGTTIFYSSSPFDKNYNLIDQKNKFIYLGFFQKDGSFQQKDVITQSIVNIIYFIKNMETKELELLKLNYSKEFQLKANMFYRRELLIDVLVDFENSKQIEKLINRAYKNVKYNDSDTKKAFLLVHFWIYSLYEDNFNGWGDQEIYNKILKEFDVENIQYEVFLEKVLNYFHFYGFTYIIKFIEKLLAISNKELPTNFARLNLFRYFWISLDDIDDDFLEIMNSIPFLQELFEMTWIIDRQERTMSAGEIVVLDILGKLYRVLNQQNTTDNILIIFDEIESLLHPEWQQKYLYILLNLVSLHSKSTINQIIFSTHSPFILSDVPKENTIFLENGKQVYPFKDTEQTFGTNIHTLLSHGFFMSTGLMGELAKEKINKIINYLYNNEISEISDDETAQKYINLLGEPILKRQFQKMLDSKRLSRIDEINELKKRIAILESKQ